MSDLDLRRAQRDTEAGPWADLPQRWRAGLLITYPCAPDVACGTAGCPPGGTRACSKCKGKGRVPANPEDTLRVLAFLGVEEARALLGIDWTLVDEIPFAGSPKLRSWPDSISRLCAKLPARRVEVECRPCEGSGYAEQCGRCKGTGKVTSDTPAEQWLLTVAALAAAWECHQLTCGCDRGSTLRYPSSDPRHHPSCDRLLKALDACAAWVEEPTRERLRSWGLREWNDAPLWVPSPCAWTEWAHRVTEPTITDSLQAAAEIAGEPRVREIASAAILALATPVS